MTDRMSSLLLVHHDMSVAKALAAQLVKEEGLYVYLSNLGARVHEFLPSVSIDLVIATQELPDTMGIDFFRELSRSYPGVTRVLLIPDSPDSDVLQALEDGVIHHYLTESGIAETFVETVSKYLNEEDQWSESVLIGDVSESSPSDFSPRAGEDVERLEKPEEELLELLPADTVEEERETPPALSSPESLPEATLLSEESMEQDLEAITDEGADNIGRETGPTQDERFGPMPSPGTSAEQEERIRELEALRDRLTGEIDGLHNTVTVLQNGFDDLPGLRNEKVRLSYLSTHLLKKTAELERRMQQMREEIDRLQNERAMARKATESHAGTFKEPIAPAPLQESLLAYGPMDIYAKAEELQQDLSKEQWINRRLDFELRNSENRLAQANKELDQVQQNLKATQKRCQNELWKYQQRCLSLQQGLRESESRYGQIKRENFELSKKLEWVQTKWTQLLNSQKKR